MNLRKKIGDLTRDEIKQKIVFVIKIIIVIALITSPIFSYLAF